MKIDIKQLNKIEKQYSEEVSLHSLKNMISVVLNYNESSYKLAPNNVKLALETLKDLKIVIDDNKEENTVQQLNS